jgi:hypothetical protein
MRKMTDQGYLLAGHSHIFSMGASQNYQGPLDLIKTADGMGHIVMEQWSGGRSSTYWEKVVEASSGRDVLISFNGNQHYGSFLFAPNPIFDFFDESAPELLNGATFVPKRLVKAYFEPSLSQLRRLVPEILAAGCRSIRLVGAPPPKSDLHVFADMIRASSFAQGFAKKHGIDLLRAEITPASLLLKLWRIVQGLTASVATDPRLAFVPVPSEALDDHGFLAKQFYDYVPADITHGNRKFGRLMIERALQTL